MKEGKVIDSYIASEYYDFSIVAISYETFISTIYIQYTNNTIYKLLVYKYFTIVWLRTNIYNDMCIMWSHIKQIASGASL